jgi:glycosyltransferase involved in cell wall biosynthesis
MRPSIFFIHTGNETFVRQDREILCRFAAVQDYYATHKFPFGFIHYLRGVKDNNLVFCWFASWNSFWVLLLAKIFGKPSLLVIGGYDVASLPGANYGHQRGGLQRWVSRAAMGLSTSLVPFSHFSQMEAKVNASIPDSKMAMIYIGVPDFFSCLPISVRESMVLTVGNVEWPNLKRKGLEFFVRSAAYLPDVQFVLVGKWLDDSVDFLRSIASTNVVFTGRVSDAELLQYYRRATVYVQASLHEGFGLSVAEAMLAGCIPVVTRNGSLPEVVGDVGVYTQSTAESDLAEAIHRAFGVSPTLSGQCRQRILDLFPLERRQQRLQAVINDLIARRYHHA